MQPTGTSVDEFLAAVTPAVRQRDAHRLIELYRAVTGLEPEMWGTIVGFGACEYRYPTGTTGAMPLGAFAPRKASLTIYTMSDFSEFSDQLQRLGTHTISKACLYIKNLDGIDIDALREIVEASYLAALRDELPGMEITVTKS